MSDNYLVLNTIDNKDWLIHSHDYDPIPDISISPKEQINTHVNKINEINKLIDEIIYLENELHEDLIEWKTKLHNNNKKREYIDTHCSFANAERTKQLIIFENEALELKKEADELEQLAIEYTKKQNELASLYNCIFNHNEVLCNSLSRSKSISSSGLTHD